MDNLCHTLAGAAMGEAGLKTRTRFGNATLMVAANLPDIDVLVFATSAPAVTFRRGWTHGVLAMAVLPLLLTAFMMAWDRWRPRRDTAGPPARLGMLLLLSYVGVGSHVLPEPDQHLRGRLSADAAPDVALAREELPEARLRPGVGDRVAHEDDVNGTDGAVCLAIPGEVRPVAKAHVVAGDRADCRRKRGTACERFRKRRRRLRRRLRHSHRDAERCSCQGPH
jgi:hypothetical protein